MQVGNRHSRFEASVTVIESDRYTGSDYQQFACRGLWIYVRFHRLYVYWHWVVGVTDHPEEGRYR